jgi:DsbC/DsbD-like thiol-disulfide interchange protein
MVRLDKTVQIALAVVMAVSGMLAETIAAHAGSQASAWAEVPNSRARLVRGIENAAGEVQIGVQIQLDPGWKTYWRNPGDSGIPPRFEWAASTNVAAIEVSWPAPEWFQDEYGNSIGYHDEVVFPITVAATDPALPIDLVMTVQFAVCREVCIPASVDLAIDLDRENSTPRYAGLIAGYVNLVPRSIEHVSGLEVADIAVDVTDDDVMLIIDVRCEDPQRTLGVFLEGPEGVYFGYPVELSGAPAGHKRFRIRADGANSAEDLSGAELRFVVVDGERRLAQTWSLE